MSKYRAKKVYVDGYKFDSKKEASRYVELKALLAAGEIKNLRMQVPYELIPHQKINGKVVELACKYYADFQYEYKGDLVVEDVKSKVTRTPAYIIKRKLMLYIHGIRISEV